MADHDDGAVSLAAIAGLGKVGAGDTANYLISRLQNAQPEIRIAVAQARGTIGDVHTKAHLAAQMNKETDPQVRDAIGMAMANIKDYSSNVKDVVIVHTGKGRQSV